MALSYEKYKVLNQQLVNHLQNQKVINNELTKKIKELQEQKLEIHEKYVELRESFESYKNGVLRCTSKTFKEICNASNLYFPNNIENSLINVSIPVNKNNNSQRRSSRNTSSSTNNIQNSIGLITEDESPRISYVNKRKRRKSSLSSLSSPILRKSRFQDDIFPSPGEPDILSNSHVENKDLESDVRVDEIYGASELLSPALMPTIIEDDEFETLHRQDFLSVLEENSSTLQSNNNISRKENNTFLIKDEICSVKQTDQSKTDTAAATSSWGIIDNITISNVPCSTPYNVRLNKNEDEKSASKSDSDLSSMFKHSKKLKVMVRRVNLEDTQKEDKNDFSSSSAVPMHSKHPKVVLERVKLNDIESDGIKITNAPKISKQTEEKVKNIENTKIVQNDSFVNEYGIKQETNRTDEIVDNKKRKYNKCAVKTENLDQPENTVTNDRRATRGVKKSFVEPSLRTKLRR